MSDARTRILERLRRAESVRPYYANTEPAREREWLARQPALGDLAARFTREQELVGGRVLPVAGWDQVPAAVAPWVREFAIGSAATGAVPRLDPLRAHLAGALGVRVLTYDREIEAQRAAIFGVDCGITTVLGAIAETGTLILIPSPAEPRLLSLAPPIHLALLERRALHPTMAAFLESGAFGSGTPGSAAPLVTTPPSNLVMISGPSRTADIELTLTIGVHGPKSLLIALIG
ncbi:MAG: LUD domain-containing protein [Candidatus Lambdaproteobacteria bacterium]|nr:LUD domain-containing protein [Candidatus Lambdaproteobacteria bacterium]